MSAITISRELGSGGTRIAQQVADRLGYRMMWRQVINEAARRAGTPELALDAIDDLGLLEVHPSARPRRAYQQTIREVMDDLVAQGDVVIVGRAGQVILSGRADVLHAQIIAPFAVRREGIASAEGISRAAARARVEESDRAQSDYLRGSYDADWKDPELYDLVVNTERLTLDAAADVICRALRGLGENRERE